MCACARANINFSSLPFSSDCQGNARLRQDSLGRAVHRYWDACLSSACILCYLLADEHGYIKTLPLLPSFVVAAGLGVIARDASIKHDKNFADVQRMSTLQKQLGLAAIDAVNANSKTGAFPPFST